MLLTKLEKCQLARRPCGTHNVVATVPFVQVFELTYNYGRDKYEKGDGYAQVAISTKDVYKTEEQLKAAGANITKNATELPGIGTKIMACTDPDGYKIVFVDNEDFLKELSK